MRTAKIIATVATIVLMGSASASSLNAPRAQAQVCSPVATSAISLIGSQGAFDLVIISPRICD